MSAISSSGKSVKQTTTAVQCPQMSLGRRGEEENNARVIQELDTELQGIDESIDS